MTKHKNVIHQIIKELTNRVEGKMFGAKCIKSVNGKTAAYYWQENMVFKLDEETQEKALQLNGAFLYQQSTLINGLILRKKRLYT